MTRRDAARVASRIESSGRRARANEWQMEAAAAERGGDKSLAKRLVTHSTRIIVERPWPSLLPSSNVHDH